MSRSTNSTLRDLSGKFSININYSQQLVSWLAYTLCINCRCWFTRCGLLLYAAQKFDSSTIMERFAPLQAQVYIHTIVFHVL